MATKEAVAKALRLWAENWPNREVAPETVQLYQQALVDVSDGVLQRAALRCVQTCNYWPTVAEVRKQVAAEATADPKLSGGLTVEQAEALQHEAQVARYRNGVYQHEAHPGVRFYGGSLEECERQYRYWREWRARLRRWTPAERAERLARFAWHDWAEPFVGLFAQYAPKEEVA